MGNYPNIILQSNCIFPATGEAAYSGYVAINEDRISALGSGSIPQELIGPDTKIIPCGDATILPGASDVHCFFTGYSVGFVGVNLENAENIAGVLNMVSAYAKQVPEDKPILGHGIKASVALPPDTKWLDKVYGDRPVILFEEGCETCYMSKSAKAKYDFTPETCYPEAYVRLLPEILTDRAFILPEFKKYMHMMNSKGITSVKEMGFDDFYGFTDLLEELEKDHALTCRIHFMSQPVGKPFDINYGKAMRDRFQSEFVRFSGYNQMTDGSISQLCGDLKQPYLCADTTCAQSIPWETLRQDALCADQEGFRFSLHAQGDAAISKVLDIYEECLRDEQGKLVNRHSITDLEFSDPADLERMGKLGVIAEIYPQIQSIADREGKIAMIEEKIGPERGAFYWNRRKMADSDVLLSCGTDLPLLIDNIPESIYHAVGGFFPEGGPAFNEQNMLTREELLTAWTKGGAYNLYRETELGTLEVGKKADIAVFSGNLLTTPLETIRSIHTTMTFVNGQKVYDAKEN